MFHELECFSFSWHSVPLLRKNWLYNLYEVTYYRNNSGNVFSGTTAIIPTTTTASGISTSTTSSQMATTTTTAETCVARYGMDDLSIIPAHFIIVSFQKPHYFDGLFFPNTLFYVCYIPCSFHSTSSVVLF